MNAFDVGIDNRLYALQNREGLTPDQRGRLRIADVAYLQDNNELAVRILTALEGELK